MSRTVFMRAGSMVPVKSWETDPEPAELMLMLARDFFLEGRVDVKEFEALVDEVLHGEVPDKLLPHLPMFPALPDPGEMVWR